MGEGGAAAMVTARSAAWGLTWEMTVAELLAELKSGCSEEVVAVEKNVPGVVGTSDDRDGGCGPGEHAAELASDDATGLRDKCPGRRKRKQSQAGGQDWLTVTALAELGPLLVTAME